MSDDWPRRLDEPEITALVSARATTWIALAGLITIDLLVIVHTTSDVLATARHTTGIRCAATIVDRRRADSTQLWITLAGALITAVAAVLWGERVARSGQLVTGLTGAAVLFAAAFTAFGMTVVCRVLLDTTTRMCGGSG